LSWIAQITKLVDIRIERRRKRRDGSRLRIERDRQSEQDIKTYALKPLKRYPLIGLTKVKVYTGIVRLAYSN